MPSASTIDAIVEAVPIVMQCPAERDMHDSTSTMSDSFIAPVLAAKLAVQHRSAGDAYRRQIARRRTHQQRGRRLVAAHHQHDAVERIGADRFLDVHRDLVAEQHRRRPHQGFAEAHHREFDRKTAGVEHARADVFGQLAEVRVAGRCLRPGVADPDDRPAVELVVRYALVFHPRAVDERVAVVTAEPRGGTKR
jgi:hypothetical protein